MQGEKRLKILDFIKNSAQAVGDLLFIFTLPYGTSYSRMEYLLEKKRDKKINQIINEKTRRCFNSFLYRLKKDGLIVKTNQGRNSLIEISPKGKKILQKIRLSILPFGKYKDKKEDVLKIVIFDIPEEERRKRDWLRSALKNLNFNMVQKSVWIGRTKLPQEFIEDMNHINIISYIEIFAITKTGSLRSLKTD